jgi:hypothetical protein
MRRMFRGRRVSPAMVVGVVALIVALAGTAVASVATISVLTHKEKRQVRKISKKVAKKLVNKKAAALTAALQTSSGFNENGTDIDSLGTAYVDVASATITTHSSGRVLATGSAELVGADADETGQCRITIDGVSSLEYEADPDDIGTNNQTVNAVNFARSLPAGVHTGTLQCRALVGTVRKDDAAINLYGLGA